MANFEYDLNDQDYQLVASQVDRQLFSGTNDYIRIIVRPTESMTQIVTLANNNQAIFYSSLSERLFEIKFHELLNKKIIFQNQNVFLPKKEVNTNSKHDLIWGYYQSLFYAWSTNEQIRFQSSTGGLLNGLSLYLLETKKVDFIQDYLLQLGAYTLAHNVVYKTNITSGVILLCTVDNLFQDFKIEGAELLMYQNLFLGRVKKFNEMNNLS